MKFNLRGKITVVCLISGALILVTVYLVLRPSCGVADCRRHLAAVWHHFRYLYSQRDKHPRRSKRSGQKSVSHQGRCQLDRVWIIIGISPPCLLTSLSLTERCRNWARPVKSTARGPLTYNSRFDKPTWMGVVRNLQAKESVAKTNAARIKFASGLTEDVDTKIHEIYEGALAVAEAMSHL